ncbi:hypothetical protein MASR2M15_01580 [Anaerolineales bacterium]
MTMMVLTIRADATELDHALINFDLIVVCQLGFDAGESPATVEKEHPVTVMATKEGVITV